MNSRCKFIRGKPFQGLEDYLKEKPIKIKNKKILYPIAHYIKNALSQESAYENSGFGLRTKLGQYYELLSKSISGGALKKLYDLEEERNGENIKSEPDLTVYKKKHLVLIEVKSIAPGQALKLIDNQIAKYVSLQTGDYFSKCPSIRFNIFRHGISKIQKKYMARPLEELICDLSKTTKFLISLPFSVIFEIYKSADDFSGSRYDGNFYNHLTRFNSSTINKLIADPEHTLEKMKINLENLIIQKRKFPDSSLLNNVKIEPFPALIVLDKLSQEEVSENIKRELNENKEISNRFLTINQEIETFSNEDTLFRQQLIEVPF